MKKRKLLSACLLPSTFLLSAIAPFLSSCSQSNHSIYLANNYTVNVHKFNIPVFFDFTPKKDVTFKLLNNDQRIHLERESGRVQKGILTLYFLIDTEVTSDTNFNFDIEFNYHSPSGKALTYCIYDVVVHYTTQEIEERDNVWLESSLVVRENSHIFTFVCNFPIKPASNKISVWLTNKSSNVFELSSDEYEIIETHGDEPHIEIDILLNMDVFEQSEYSFDLNISFLNSYQNWQTDVFQGCAIQYRRSVSESVPLDYLDLEPTESSNGDSYILHGLKANVPRVEAGRYRILDIPNNVVSIDEKAFIDSEWFSGIRKIKVPKSVNDIGLGAFNGINHIYEIDLLDYQDQPVPQWYKDNKSLFTKEEMEFLCGYMWIPSSFSKKEDYFNLPNDWKAFSTDETTNEEDFTLNEDKTAITGLNPNKINEWKNKKVIKFPEKIQTVQKGAFKQLKTIPYFSSQLNRYETRRIFFSRTLETISDHEFLTAGISGPMFFCCDSLQSVSESLFEYCSCYDYPPLEGVYKEDTQIFFTDFNSLEGIDDKAFNHIDPLVGTLSLPINIKRVNDYAFLDHSLNKIIFDDQCDQVGQRAFANTTYPSPKSLSVIDLTKYTTIKNPGEEKPTYQPYWFKEIDFAFDGACAEEGTVIINEQMSKESEIDEDIDKWFDTFCDNHSIPSDWTLTIEEK